MIIIVIYTVISRLARYIKPSAAESPSRNWVTLTEIHVKTTNQCNHCRFRFVPMQISILAVTNLHIVQKVNALWLYDQPCSNPRKKGKRSALSYVTSEIRTYTQHKNKHRLSHTNTNKQDPRSALSLSIAISYKTKINLKTQNKKKSFRSTLKPKEVHNSKTN